MRNRYRFNIKADLLVATKGKIIFGFAMAVLALVAAWGISKLVFDEMIATVEEVSKPDKKLDLVNYIFNSVSRLDQKQKYRALSKANDSVFITESSAIKLSLDTLSTLYARDSLQLKRIKSIKELLAKRDQQFSLYLQVRDSLLNTNVFSNEIEKLNSLFAERAFQADSAIYTTESKTSTTTLEDNGNKGFFNRLFGKKKPDAFKVVSEELKIKKDTLNQFLEDSILRSMESSLNHIKIQQKLKSNTFIAKERSLASTSNQLTQQILSVLEEVRSEALSQIVLKGKRARVVVNKGITKITLILVGFFVLTVLLVYLILTDISKSKRYSLALKKAKELAEYNARAKERFLSNMSHEIRTPLQSIVGYSELIQKTEIPDKNAVKAINLSAVHLLYIINEILDYSRIVSGKFSLKQEAFDAKEAINEVLLTMQALAYQKGLSLTSDLVAEDNMWIKGDCFRLKQILYNLLGNAIKFTEQGNIHLASSTTETNHEMILNLQIKDTGVGIDGKKVASLFDEFDSGNHKETFDFNSTGLGLSIVKQLVELNKGNIAVRSEVGIGTTFYLELRYPYASQKEVTKVSKPQPSKKTLTGNKVWIIDDDQLILDLCGIILTKKRIAFQTFNEPRLLLDYKVPENLKYVLMDIRMPQIDGITLFQILKKRVSPSVKFYAITAQVLAKEQEKILEAGFDGIVIKPFTEENLLSILVDSKSVFENFNPENLKKMTFGDQNQLKKVLERFVTDCLADIELLKEQIQNKDFNLSRLIVHRLAGRTGQIGYKGLAYEFRKLEQKLYPENTFSEELVSEINHGTQKLKQFIDFVVAKNYSI